MIFFKPALIISAKGEGRMGRRRIRKEKKDNEKQ